MSEILQGNRRDAALPTRVNVPVVERLNGRTIEITYLGRGATEERTWLLWNPDEPFLVGLVRQGKIGYRLEYRTDSGVEVLENVPLQRIRTAISR